MFLDIVGSTAYGREHDPGVVLMTTNQMMAEFEPVFKEHEIQVTDYQGDGFMSIARGENHARRATAAALALIDAVEQFNEPRRILQEYGVDAAKPLQVRVGLATGEVFVGNIGTYEKMSFAAIGTTTNLAARLQSAAEPGLPCLSRATFAESRGRFRFADQEGRVVSAKGLEDQQVWDVVGRE
jgi:class 3 adenylate cyclase